MMRDAHGKWAEAQTDFALLGRRELSEARVAVMEMCPLVEMISKRGA